MDLTITFIPYKKRMKGKIFRSVPLIFLFVILLFPSSMKALQRENKEEYHQYGDSLHILDSLVTVHKFRDNALSLSYARKALAIAKRTGSPEARIKAYSLLGGLFEQNARDSSYYYYTQALKIIDQYDLPAQRPRIIYDIALLYNIAYNYKTAIVLLDSSATLAVKSQDYKLLSLIYIALGNIKYQLNDSSGSHHMYELAFRTAKEHLLYDEMANAYGNLGKFEKDSAAFIRIQKKAMEWLKINPGNEREIATLMTNLGFMCSDPDTAIYYYRSALQMIKNGNNSEVELGIYNNMAYSYLSKKDLKHAEECLSDHAIPVAMKADNKDWLSTLYDSYADILKAQGKYREEAESRKKSMEFRSEADLKTGSEQVRLLSSLLDLQNKDQEILFQQARLKQAYLWLTISGLLLILGSFLFVLFFQRSRIKLQREQITTAKKIIGMEENEKGRVARELHDITGQMVLSIREEIENSDLSDPLNKINLIEKIENIGKDLRRLSHHMNKVMIDRKDLNELITSLCEDFFKLTGLSIHLELPEKEYELPSETVLHIYRIIQELLMNAGKYCIGELVRIRISHDEKTLTIKYIDNGTGFDPERVKGSGMGIMNITERARLIGGKSILESSPGSGTTWDISVPLNTKRNWYKI
jgi:signal transduction histidine kinase